MKKIKSLPLVIILLVIWAILRFSQFELSNQISLIVASFSAIAVLAFEFYKSGDITLKNFGSDMFFAIVAIAIFCVVETTLILKGYHFDFSDVLMGIVVFVDGWFSPFNSFRTALRNFQVGESE